MAFDYAGAQEDARELLAEFGAMHAIKHDAVDVPCLAAVLDYSFDAMGTGMIGASDRRVIVEPVAFEPVPGVDLFMLNGVAHKIIPPVRKLDPAGTVVYYELQVRR